MDRQTEILTSRLVWLVVAAILAAAPWVLTMRRPQSPPGQPAGIEADMVDSPQPWPRPVWIAPEGSRRVRPIGREVELRPVPAGPATATPRSVGSTARGLTAERTPARRRPSLPIPPIDARTAAVLRTGFPAVVEGVLASQSASAPEKTDRPLADVQKKGARPNRLRPDAGTPDEAHPGASALANQSVDNPPQTLRAPFAANSSPTSRQADEVLHDEASPEQTSRREARPEGVGPDRNPRALLERRAEPSAKGPRLVVPSTPFDELWLEGTPADQPTPADGAQAPCLPQAPSEPLLPEVDSPGHAAVGQSPTVEQPPSAGQLPAVGQAPSVSQSPSVGRAPSAGAVPELPASEGPQLDSPTAAPRTILQPAALPLVPDTAIEGHSAEMERIARQADQQTRKGFELAGHRAYFAARARFIGALRLMAQGLDMEHQTKAHSRALAAGLRAMKEAEDFLPQSGRLEADLDIAAIVAGHQTPVLKGVASDRLSPYSALRCYLTFAQEQLAAAAGSEVAGSMALHGLGKLHAVLAEDRAAPIRASEPKAVACFQAALLVFPRNFMAANDLAVLLARREDYTHARALLEHSLSICPQATGWHNLAVVYERSGLIDLARRAERLAQVWRNAELAHRGGRPAEQPRIQWVDPATFARYQTDFPGAGPPRRSIGPAASAPTDTSAAAQPGRPPAGSHFARRPPDIPPAPPNRR